MLRYNNAWDIRCPQALTRLFPTRGGYYYKIDRLQAQQVCNTLSKAYGIDPSLVRVALEQPGYYNGTRQRCNGDCTYHTGGHSVIRVHARGHIKSTFHEWYHALDHATRGRYNSSDRQGGDTSLAWQFADRLFEVFRHQRSTTSMEPIMTTKTSKSKSSKSTKASKKAVKAKSSAKGVSATRNKHPERVEFKAATKVSKLRERDKRGQRTQLLQLIPKSGVTVSKLTIEARKAELNIKKLPHMLERLHYYGFVDAR